MAFFIIKSQYLHSLNKTSFIPLNLENLDPDAEVVSYCWTGQTSSMLTAYLTNLGYNAKSLKFGVNSIIYDDLIGHKWSASMDYVYDVTP